MRTTLFLVVFALFCPSAIAQKSEPRYEGKPISYWVERLQKAATDMDRDEAGKALIAFGSDGVAAVPALLEMLDDKSESYRERVARILCEIGPGAKEAVPELAKRLKEKLALKPREGKERENEVYIKYLIEIIGSIGPDAKEAIPVLITALSQPDYAYVVIQVLCGIGPEAKVAIPAIRSAIFDSIARENATYTRRTQSSGEDVFEFSAPYQLQKLGPDVLPLLLDLADIASANVYALSNIGELGSAASKALPKLTPMLRDKNRYVRFNAAVALWKIEKTKAVIPVLAELLQENDPDMVIRAVVLLGEMGPDAKEALPALNKALKYNFNPPVPTPIEPPVFVTPSGTSPLLHPELQVQNAAKEAIQKIAPSKKK